MENLEQANVEHILNQMLDTDPEYKRLVKTRSDASMALRKALDHVNGGAELFESYSDAIYAQEIYELNATYAAGASISLRSISLR